MNSRSSDPVRHEVLAYLDRHPTSSGRPTCLITLAELSELSVRSWREGLTVGIAEGYFSVLDEERNRVDPGNVGECVPLLVVPNGQRVQTA